MNIPEPAPHPAPPARESAHTHRAPFPKVLERRTLYIQAAHFAGTKRSPRQDRPSIRRALSLDSGASTCSECYYAYYLGDVHRTAFVEEDLERNFGSTTGHASSTTKRGALKWLTQEADARNWSSPKHVQPEEGRNEPAPRAIKFRKSRAEITL